MGFEPTTSSMPSRRAPNCATAPPLQNSNLKTFPVSPGRDPNCATAPPEVHRKFYHKICSAGLRLTDLKVGHYIWRGKTCENLGEEGGLKPHLRCLDFE